MIPAKARVRLAVAEDLDAIVALERAADTAPHWPTAAYAAILNLPPGAPLRCLFVAEGPRRDEGVGQAAIAGFAVGLVSPCAPNPHPAEARAELESVAVTPSARRAGIGSALCVAVLDWCRDQGATEAILEVRAASVSAIALYRGLGFASAGRRPKYYNDPADDALAMRLVLR